MCRGVSQCIAKPSGGPASACSSSQLASLKSPQSPPAFKWLRHPELAPKCAIMAHFTPRGGWGGGTVGIRWGHGGGTVTFRRPRRRLPVCHFGTQSPARLDCQSAITAPKNPFRPRSVLGQLVPLFPHHYAIQEAGGSCRPGYLIAAWVLGFELILMLPATGALCCGTPVLTHQTRHSNYPTPLWGIGTLGY